MRNRYLDLLRAAAIVRVIIYHLFGWPWLSIVLPAMGVMFALAGSLAAASLDQRSARRVVTSRLRRLLPPLWLLGLIALPVMVIAGWAHESDGAHPFSIARLGFWLLPLGDPPGSDKGIDIWEPLWYLRAYVWFILLSPLLYFAYRRIGLVTVVVPIVLMAVLDKTGFSLPDTADAAMWDFVTYGACWITGFAHHDGRLVRLRAGFVVLTALGLGAAALYWLTEHQGKDAWDLNDVSQSQALWSLAFVLVALRWQPSMTWLGKVKPLDRLVTLLNARAVTIYLWHNIAIALIWPLLAYVTLDDLGWLSGPVDLTVALLLTGLAVLAFGWAEDLAAQRRPRLWPASGSIARRAPTAPGHSPTAVTVLVATPASQPVLLAAAPAGHTALFGAEAPAGPGSNSLAAALRGRTGAQAAITRRPANQPPAPRAGAVEANSAGPGIPAQPDATRELALPAAQRPDAPIGEQPPVNPGQSNEWDPQSTDTWAALGPTLGSPSQFGWTAAPDEPTTTHRPRYHQP